MNLRLTGCCLLLSFCAAVPAFAATPPMPPWTNGDGNPANNGMKHALVSPPDSSGALSVHQQVPPATPVTMMSGHGVDFDPLFDVLEGRYFNSQYGWLPEGILVPPTGSGVWIKRTGLIAPAGATLKVYEGGTGGAMSSWTMNEIYAADGDAWLWDRVMQHDLYVADLPGAYGMSFEVYLGDATTGLPTAGYTPGTTTFEFIVPVPEPASWMLALVGLGVAAVRRFPAPR